MSHSNRKPRLIIVESDAATADLISQATLKEGYVPVVYTTIREARAAKLGEASTMILELELPDGDGFDLLSFVRRHHPELPCFVLTARDSAESAVSALKAGACDYFTKPFDPSRVFASMRELVGVAPAKPQSAEPLVGGDWRSSAMIGLEQAAAAAATVHSPVLLIGEPGSGKRSLAASIHARSRRSTHPFASVDAGSGDAAALEQELFGGDAGKSSSRSALKRGKIEITHGGTLYIQNIELLLPSLQARLLDALEMRPEASFAAWSDFRLIASSGTPLQPHVDAGTFRRDLFFRLAITILHVPHLRDIPEDLLAWCDRLLTEICLTLRCRRPHLSRGAKEALLDHSWPGNLDELRQVLEQAVSRAKSGIIGLEELPPGFSSLQAPKGNENLMGFARINDLERAALIAALDACDGNRRRAAKRLGVSIRTIYNMIDRHALRSTERPADPS